MQRPPLITALSLLEIVIGLLYAASVPYMWMLAKSVATASGTDAGAAMGLKSGAAMVAALSVISLVAGVALWKTRSWGRWLAIAANGFMFVLMLYGLFDDGLKNIDMDDVMVTLVYGALTIPFLLPAVGRRLSSTVKPNVGESVD